MTTPPDISEAVVSRELAHLDLVATNARENFEDHATAATISDAMDMISALRSALTASEKRVKELERRMTDARRILTKGNPTPDCNWGILDVTKDLGHDY